MRMLFFYNRTMPFAKKQKGVHWTAICIWGLTVSTWSRWATVIHGSIYLLLTLQYQYCFDKTMYFREDGFWLLLIRRLEVLFLAIISFKITILKQVFARSKYVDSLNLGTYKTTGILDELTRFNNTMMVCNLV